MAERGKNNEKVNKVYHNIKEYGENIDIYIQFMKVEQ